MQAVILAAGQSQRFYPFRSLSHKSMVRLMGKPLLQYTLEALKAANFSKVIIVIAKNSSIPQEIKEISGLSVTFIVQKEALGMGHALLEAEKELDQTFFLLSGYHMDIADFVQEMQTAQKTKDYVVLLGKEDAIFERYGVLETKGEKVCSISEKPYEKAASGLRLIGIYLLNKAFMQTLKSIPTEHYHFEKALDAFARTNDVVFVKASMPSITLKHSWDLLSVKDYVLSKIKRSISKKTTIAKNAIIEGNVIVSDGVRILEGACIKGPCYIGENAVIGNSAIVRNGVIVESSVVVGATMEVKNSILMEGVTTHTGFIGDSIIGPHSRIAAGFCSANVRFDREHIHAHVHDKIVNTFRNHMGVVVGEHVDTGINVATMPGISIGNHVTVGPGTMVMENVLDNALVYTKFQTVIKQKK